MNKNGERMIPRREFGLRSLVAFVVAGLSSLVGLKPTQAAKAADSKEIFTPRFRWTYRQNSRVHQDGNGNVIRKEIYNELVLLEFHGMPLQADFLDLTGKYGGGVLRTNDGCVYRTYPIGWRREEKPIPDVVSRIRCYVRPYPLTDEERESVERLIKLISSSYETEQPCPIPLNKLIVEWSSTPTGTV